ncbi:MULTISPECIES: hypothetical protein [Streptomyces]|uniref:Uncharacterized protein n=1 Tax=Streptomyces sudanensis TaxID=436397 RepID=A0ABY4TB82_9ACTN|nr:MULTISPECIES: hypothetical protein [Streptomyces]MCP9958889.1 hypothetical protein [Streptomyces sudanensis]MCP9987957.1 hypothetical protein [Streptomyces sudanensis]MCQ0000633.1 hypothetical protein [Streptomyces sudanensis]URN16219.1 hypothetical protein MW084_09940 [Streptomyces sudanensis]
MAGDVTDPAGRAALESLSSALEPYFETPEYFRSILGKIAMAMIDADTEEQITSRTFDNIDEFKAVLPEGVVVTTL